MCQFSLHPLYKNQIEKIEALHSEKFVADSIMGNLPSLNPNYKIILKPTD